MNNYLGKRIFLVNTFVLSIFLFALFSVLPVAVLATETPPCGPPPNNDCIRVPGEASGLVDILKNGDSTNNLNDASGIPTSTGPIKIRNFEIDTDSKVIVGAGTGLNAELDIKSGSNNAWGIYQDSATGQIRFKYDTSDKFLLSKEGDATIQGNTQVGGNLEVGQATSLGGARFLVSKDASGKKGFFVGFDSNGNTLISASPLDSVSVASQDGPQPPIRNWGGIPPQPAVVVQAAATEDDNKESQVTASNANSSGQTVNSNTQESANKDIVSHPLTLQWIGLDRDVVDRYEGKAGGGTDGHFKLTVGGVEQFHYLEIESLNLSLVDQGNNPISGQTWHTEDQKYYLLGAIQYSDLVNTTYAKQLSFYNGSTWSGTESVDIDLFATDSSFFKSGARYRVSIVFKGGQLGAATVTLPQITRYTYKWDKTTDTGSPIYVDPNIYSLYSDMRAIIYAPRGVSPECSCSSSVAADDCHETFVTTQDFGPKCYDYYQEVSNNQRRFYARPLSKSSEQLTRKSGILDNILALIKTPLISSSFADEGQPSNKEVQAGNHLVIQPNDNDFISVGAGTPLYKLDVSGAVRGTQMCVGSRQDATCKAKWDWITDGTNLFANTSGYIGIGTAAAPTAKLEVVGNVKATGFCMGNDNDCKTSWSQVGQWATADNNKDIYYSEGSVGVGTNIPRHTNGVKNSFDVNGQVLANQLMITQSSAADSKLWRFETDDASALKISHQNSVNTAESPKLIISENGNVGVGIANPQAKLVVNGNLVVRSDEYTRGQLSPIKGVPRCYCDVDQSENCPERFSAAVTDPQICWDQVGNSSRSYSRGNKDGNIDVQGKVTASRFELLPARSLFAGGDRMLDYRTVQGRVMIGVITPTTPGFYRPYASCTDTCSGYADDIEEGGSYQCLLPIQLTDNEGHRKIGDGCSTGNERQTVCLCGPQPAFTTARITSFIASNPAIRAGEKTTLTWQAKGAVTVNGSYAGADNGSWNISPLEDTTYELKAFDDNGEVSKSVSVTVNPVIGNVQKSEVWADPDAAASEKNKLEQDFTFTVLGAAKVSIADCTGRLLPPNELGRSQNEYTYEAKYIVGQAAQTCAITAETPSGRQYTANFTRDVYTLEKVAPTLTFSPAVIAPRPSFVKSGDPLASVQLKWTGAKGGDVREYKIEGMRREDKQQIQDCGKKGFLGLFGNIQDCVAVADNFDTKTALIRGTTIYPHQLDGNEDSRQFTIVAVYEDGSTIRSNTVTVPFQSFQSLLEGAGSLNVSNLSGLQQPTTNWGEINVPCGIAGCSIVESQTGSTGGTSTGGGIPETRGDFPGSDSTKQGAPAPTNEGMSSGKTVGTGGVFTDGNSGSRVLVDPTGPTIYVGGGGMETVGGTRSQPGGSTGEGGAAVGDFPTTPSTTNGGAALIGNNGSQLTTQALTQWGGISWFLGSGDAFNVIPPAR